MSRSQGFVAAILALVVLLIPGAIPEGADIRDAAAPRTTAAAVRGPFSAQEQVTGPELSKAVRFDVSPLLSSIPLTSTGPDANFTKHGADSFSVGEDSPFTGDGALQTSMSEGEIPEPSLSFDGLGNLNDVVPPDPVGDVGPGHYVQMVNASFAIYDKTGLLLYGPAGNNVLWQGFGGDCETGTASYPIVLHDQLADRWILSQVTTSGPHYFACVAVSTGPNPAGSYYRYAFQLSTNFPGEPKYGVWPDAYYISTRELDRPGGRIVGIGAYALEREAMVAGNPSARAMRFLRTHATTPYLVGDGLLPSDLDGSTPPPVGRPNYFVGTQDDDGPYGARMDALNIWAFHVDWADIPASSFTHRGSLPVASFDSMFPCGSGHECIPQPGTTVKLDILSYRQQPAWRLAYRNFGAHESLVTNQSVEAQQGLAGIRWYEIRSPDDNPVVYQQGTFAPGAIYHRWMGSIAMDRAGNMALGYSISNAFSLRPSVFYTGRLVSDPPGMLPQGEERFILGTGAQTGSSRWGEYTSMNVDPVDDCTFWYVNQYYAATSPSGWRTRIGAFKYPQCDPAPTTTPATTATHTPTRAPTQTPGGPTATPIPCELQFTDVPTNSTYYPFVRCLACWGIISGYPCGAPGEPCDAASNPYFRPNNYITRGQLAKVVSDSAGYSEVVPPSQWTFADVPYGSTFWLWIERIANHGVMSGYPCGGPNEPCDFENRQYFRPRNGASRGQLAKTVSNAAGFNDAIPETQYTFADAPPSSPFWLFVERLLLNRPEVMSGYVCGTVPSEPCDAENRPYFRPNNPLTRGQTSKIVANTFFPGCDPAAKR